MSRSDIGIKPTYIIVGLDDQNVEHFIESSCSQVCYLVMLFRTLMCNFNKKLTNRYKKIYLRKLYV